MHLSKRIMDIYCIDYDSQIGNSNPVALEQWYGRLLNKKVDDLNLEDVSRMLGQRVFLELGIEKAMEILSEDPLAGEMYEGHLLELLYGIELGEFQDMEQLKILLRHIHASLPQFEWPHQEEQEEYADLVQRFIAKF
ncbi:contact-dependent growth inhibition system immunity protein [Paenibacillus polysaccharolyticus]|uniref:contact-dependent growth inhibition system immunity protein n=1 Tax=Paenibacillus polysaccharolyticus TaxID=582692 RepID=UPI002041D9BB